MTDPADFTAHEALARMARGELRANELVEAQLRRIAAKEPEIGAFAFLDADMARQAAKAVDAHRASGRPIGGLHGLAVGVKDIIDTADMPTENGTIIDAGRRPGKDATIVRRLRQAGAIVMGKTVTAELASMGPGKTRNPHDPGRTPGGSSSGSAAAVAAGMVPLAIGTQTFGSVIRPASFCGVVGFKPSHGLVPRTGMRVHSRELDTVGVFARDVADAALLADALAGHDPEDADTRLLPPPRLLEIAMTEPPVTPSLAFVKTPVWDRAEPATQEGFGELVAALGDTCTEVTLPELYEEALGALKSLMQAGMARGLAAYYRKGKEQLSPALRGVIEEGLKVTAVDYLTARDWREALGNGLEQLFDRYDAIVTPAANGEAPRGLDSTGDPAFSGLWTLCGVPAISLPLLTGPNGLPVGVQLVGRRGEDARLLRTARWLTRRIEAQA
ncbi:MAG: amidase [Rhodospirillaceae bacterium]|jgi:Asp-tRNA(Asn)/Glu-tRNA(Gln) amidotransferase A subunit family amidase|nr:amidase [Rhodospirillaceae bacterium]